MKEFQVASWKLIKNNFLDFICGSPTSTQVLSHDEEIEARPSGTAREEEMQTKEPKDLRSGAVQEAKIQLKKPQDLEGRGQEEKKPQKNQ